MIANGSWTAALAGAGEQVLARLDAVFVSPASDFSLLSMASAVLVAAAFLAVRRGRARPVRTTALVRALLPRSWATSPSVRADIGLLLLNVFATGALLGWAIVTSGFVERSVGAMLGEGGGIPVPRWLLAVIVTGAFYFAYEAMYYADHWLKHNVPVLWHFHRVHHSAEHLNPLTNARMHPVDSVIFANIVALGTGTAMALVHRLFEAPGGPLAIGHSNAIMLAALYLILHLHHSHVWLPFTGRLGRWVLSPAHHQLHHSTDPAHFNRNLGATLALFDRLAGTLLVPEKQRQMLAFGAGPYDYDPHSVSGTLIQPFVDAAREVQPRATDLPDPVPATR